LNFKKAVKKEIFLYSFEAELSCLFFLLHHEAEDIDCVEHPGKAEDKVQAFDYVKAVQNALQLS
jgi:hypothetical protein